MDKLAQRSTGLSVPVNGERSITYPRPSELFAANTKYPKRDALIMACTRLAAAVKATVNEGEMGIYADALEDMKPRALELAFIWCERHHTICALPTPGELRERGEELLRQEWRRDREAREEQARMAPHRTDECYGMADLQDAAKRVLAKKKAVTVELTPEQRKKGHELLLAAEFHLQLCRRAAIEGWPVQPMRSPSF